MKEFVMIFRNDYKADAYTSPENLQGLMKSWMDWMGGFAAQNKLASSGNRLGNAGKTVKPGNVITDGPFVELKESVGGYIIVKAASIEEAAEMAKGCPILSIGGSVEIRDIVAMNS